MTAAEIIQSCDFDGVHLDLTPEGKLHYSGDPAMVTEWLPILREHKAAIVAELHRERRREKVQAMLGDGRYAALAENTDTDPVIATVAIRGLATFEMAIPKHSYDGIVLLEILEQHTAEMPVQPSQISGNAIAPPEGNKRSTAHPGRAA